jgi:formylglycine-generating enzyme required for sulfatase activity
MVVIPAGVFQMGDHQGSGEDDEKPVHEVHIAKSFAMGKYPLTFADYDRFAKATDRELPSDEDWGRDNRPVINVSWDDAVTYTEWLSEQIGQRYRLPTEAEWEYAARAGTETDYWWGEWKPKMANCGNLPLLTSLAGRKTSPASSFPANAFGLHDTAGNVWEWVQDCWHKNYEDAPADGSAWLAEDDGDCAQRVVRGGSWLNGLQSVRSAFRNEGTPGERSSAIGFRLAQDL